MIKRLPLVAVGVLFLPGDGADRSAFPDSGTQIAIAAAVVVVLLVGGIALWYFSHPRRRKHDDSPDDRPVQRD